MATLTRVTGKVFAGDVPITQVGQFGSAYTGTPNPTTDVATIQALAAYTKGWGSAVISSRNFPPIEEVNGVLKTISYQGCYLLQEGIPEYDIGTEYSNTSIVKSINDDKINFYLSLENNNIGNSLTNTTYWKSFDYATTAELNTKADVDGSNMDASVKNFDGQWVEAFAELSTSSSTGTYNIDLSSYLPSDSYAYEVLVGCEMYTDGISKLQSISSSIITTFVNVNHTESYADGSVGTCILPIGTDRMLYYKISNNGGGTCRLKLNAYRRIGIVHLFHSIAVNVHQLMALGTHQCHCRVA